MKKLLPDSWPKQGSLDGEPVDILEAMDSLDPTELAGVEVEVDGGTLRPFRFGQGEPQAFAGGEDGHLVI